MQFKQGEALPVFISNRILSQLEISTIQLQFFSYDWFGNVPIANTSFQFVIDPEKIYFNFICQQKPFYNEKTKSHQFIEGLSQYDIAEIFLKEDDSNRYQEFNFSPSGAWWSALFSSYRKQDKECHIAGNDFCIDSSMDRSSWRVHCCINRQALAINFSASTLSNANVTAIINGNDRQYLSWSRIVSSQPDFHKTEYYCRVLPIEF